MTRPIVRLRDVTVAYDRHPAVHHLSGIFLAGSMTAIAGPNGAGKSTLLKALMGQLPLASGSIEREALNPAEIAYLAQAAEIDRRFRITVGDAILLGAWRQTGAFRAVSRDSAAEARRALASVGLTDFERRKLRDLASKIDDELGMEPVSDSGARVAMRIPGRLLSVRNATDAGTSYVSEDGEISLETMHASLADQSFEQLFETMTKPDPERIVTYRSFGAGRFVVSGRRSRRRAGVQRPPRGARPAHLPYSPAPPGLPTTRSGSLSTRPTTP